MRGGAAELAALEHWAPAPLLEATALLAGASGHDERVRAYALRSLTSASKPEEVDAIAFKRDLFSKPQDMTSVCGHTRCAR